MKRKMHIYCPYCGRKLLDGYEVSGVSIQCKKCHIKIFINFGDSKIYIAIMDRRNLLIDDSA